MLWRVFTQRRNNAALGRTQGCDGVSGNGAFRHDLLLAVAEDRIRVSRDAALGNVRTIASDIAAAITDKLTGVAATADEVETALTAAKA